MGTRDLLFVGLVLGGALGLGASLYPPRVQPDKAPAQPQTTTDPDIAATAHAVDAAFRKSWDSQKISPAPWASELTVVRRLSLALTGSIPSLEELRRLESVKQGGQASAWAGWLVRDRRTSDYLAERLARAYVGTEGGPFIVFRRRRFVTWLSDQIHEGRPYDQVVRELVASDGIWTDRPATNFVTVTYDPDKKLIDPERLAGRVARAFLGARIDCAQCHNHPFAPWKQHDFQGLAAFFGKAESGLMGIHEGKTEWMPVNRKTGKTSVAAPCVPFHPELLPEHGPRRVRLAAWLTDPKNNALPRATVNRVWALLFGRALVEPVDDLVTAEEVPEAVTILADDFVAHGYDLRRLIRIIAATQTFHLDSAADPEPTVEQEKAWAVFPLSPLRPEQIAGAITQSASLTTLDGEAPIVSRLIKLIGESGFVKRYGDFGEEELEPHAATIPQRLLLMNGEMVRDQTKPDMFHAAARIGSYAPTDRAAVEVAYLTVLTRRPTPEESTHFETNLARTRGNTRSERMSDLIWTLVNATEFSWNH
jgi:Protein of unknown function (DUF1549)/Protein of unknown function (DUF1553)